MRKQLLTLPIICFCVALNAQSKIDVLHYKYEIRLSDTTDNISGIATIYLRANMPAEFLELDFNDVGKNGKGMKITDLNTPAALDIRITASPTLMEYSHENDKLKIKLPKKLLTGENDTIAIEYKGIPSDGLIISKNKFGDRTFFADNWPDRAHNWIPCVDDPDDKASFEFWVMAPSQYKVISNGVLAEEKITGANKLTVWKEDVPLSTKVMVIGVAKFATKIFDDSPVGLPVSAWVYPQDSIKGFRNYSTAPAIVKFFSNYIGAFPYNKLANVQSTTRFGGMENASAIFYNEASASSNRSVEDLLAHEIAHQWFGDMATEKSFSHLWLSEGFATYFTDLYIESKYGTDSMNKRMQNEREEVIDFVKTFRRPVIDSVSPYMQLLNPNSYQKGGWVLHMLRRQIGDSVFHQSIRTYYDMYKGKNATTEDLRAVFEKISGKNLDTFFHQWLYTAGIPQLDITWKYNAKDENVAITIKQIQKTRLFSFPLDIYIQESVSMPKIISRVISKDSQTFTFPARTKPLKIKIDPFTSLLFEGTVNELK